MINEPIWIREDITRVVHHRQIAEHGGGDGIRDEGLLLSALERPRNTFAYADPISETQPDLADIAAAYAFGIARNHPFVDGNKRTSLILARVFLLRNGVDITATQEEKYETFLALASGSLSEVELACWLRERAVINSSF